ncbi:hypothetical protein LZC95_32095 [Pendulispora brunnea]|uniref:HNH nuclease domain-containing protein n=1 Tax=Pendulispora brunnea TaxID=2905690 RepID=A0ABZ2JX65_9BACT
MNLTDLSNDEVLSGLHALVGQGRVLLARLLAYLAEVEERRLDLQAACSSLFDYCVRRLAMSDDEACRRVTASRIVRRYPLALAMIERGELHLTSLLLLRERLTDDNHEELLRAAAGKTKAQVQELLAARFPRPDTPSLIRPLPNATAHRVEPIAPERYEVQFTATKDLKEKLDHATNLMRHANPRGDLSVVVERALDLLIDELEKRRLGKAKRPAAPGPTRESTRPGYVTRAVRREVFARDGAQCTFIDECGRRCESRAFLELDHVQARALGGRDTVPNLVVRCRAHNGLAAERDFGRDYIDRRKAEKTPHPLQRRYESDIALRALTALGFKEPQARRALETIEKRWPSVPPPIETILRETLSILT